MCHTLLLLTNPAPSLAVPRFQYVRITPNGSTGFQGQLNDIVGLAIHTNMTQTGFLDFGGDGVAGSASEQAAEVLTGINSMTLQSQRTNVAAYIPTDCPTREKHVSALSAVNSYLYAAQSSVKLCTARARTHTHARTPFL